MTASLPHPDDSPRPSGNRAHVIRRRALTLLIILLLIGVPAGYLAISADQSRDSGKDKERKYAARGLTPVWPSRLQSRLYQVPVPPYAENVASYETNNWRTSRLYVQFLTSDERLDRFLAQLGTSTDELTRGEITINARDRRVVGWEFTGEGPWFGLVRARKNPTPTLDIVVNRSNPRYPMVYVVSRTTP